MTSNEIETAARRRLNAVNDDFWSAAEIIEDYLYAAECELAMEAKTIQDTTTSSTAIGTSTYSFPSLTISVKRLTYEGYKLKRIDYRQYDSVSTPGNTTSGTPAYYMDIGSDTFELYPVPSAVGTLKWWRYKLPTQPTAGSTPTTPARWHPYLINGVCARMAAKEIGSPRFDSFYNLWLADIAKVKSLRSLETVTDSFPRVKTEEEVPGVDFGEI